MSKAPLIRKTLEEPCEKYTSHMTCKSTLLCQRRGEKRAKFSTIAPVLTLVFKTLRRRYNLTLCIQRVVLNLEAETTYALMQSTGTILNFEDGV